MISKKKTVNLIKFLEDISEYEKIISIYDSLVVLDILKKHLKLIPHRNQAACENRLDILIGIFPKDGEDYERVMKWIERSERNK